MIYISSIAVIGETESSAENPIRPDFPCHPKRNYGIAKLRCEDEVAKNCNSYWIVRPTNIVDGIESGILSEMNRAFLSGASYPLYNATKDKLRDYIAVEDVIDSIYNLALHPELLAEDERIIILGSGHSYSFQEVVDLFREKIEPSFQVEITNPDKAIAAVDIVVDALQTRKLLCREPKTLQEIIVGIR